MKLQLILPALALVGLAACSKEDVPASVTAPAPTAAAMEETDATQTEGLSQVPDQLTAEEIQARREAWVRGGAPAERVAAAPRASRE